MPCNDGIEEPEPINIRKKTSKDVENVFDDCGDDLLGIMLDEKHFVALIKENGSRPSRHKSLNKYVNSTVGNDSETTF